MDIVQRHGNLVQHTPASSCVITPSVFKIDYTMADGKHSQLASYIHSGVNQQIILLNGFHWWECIGSLLTVIKILLNIRTVQVNIILARSVVEFNQQGQWWNLISTSATFCFFLNDYLVCLSNGHREPCIHIWPLIYSHWCTVLWHAKSS